MSPTEGDSSPPRRPVTLRTVTLPAPPHATARQRQRFWEVRLDQAARRLEGSEETKRLKLRRDNASRGIVASRAFASFEVKKKKKKKRE